jgi:hypothetical protein
MILETALRKYLDRAYGDVTWDENPLVTIGLSHSILSLKVTEEQLFSIVRGYVRRLAQAIHPDTKAIGGIIETEDMIQERNKIMQAFELLDDEKVFIKALQEFRTIKGGELREITSLRGSLRVVRSRMGSVENENRELILSKLKLEQDQGAFNLRKLREKDLVPGLQIKLDSAISSGNHWWESYKEQLRRDRNLEDFVDYFVFKKPLNLQLPSEALQVYLLSFEMLTYKGGAEPIIPTLPDGTFNLISDRYAKYIDRIQSTIMEKRFRDVMVQYQVLKHPIVKGRITDSQEQFLGTVEFEKLIYSMTKRQFVDNGSVLRYRERNISAGELLISLAPRKDSNTKLLKKLMGRYDEARKLSDRSICKMANVVLGISAVCRQCESEQVTELCRKCSAQICSICDHTRDICGIVGAKVEAERKELLKIWEYERRVNEKTTA